MCQTDRQTDGQTEFSSLYRVCITCSAVKTMTGHSMRMHGRIWHSKYSVSQKISPLKLLAIFSLKLRIFSGNFVKLLPIYTCIHPYLPILVDLSQYLLKWHWLFDNRCTISSFKFTKSNLCTFSLRMSDFLLYYHVWEQWWSLITILQSKPKTVHITGESNQQCRSRFPQLQTRVTVNGGKFKQKMRQFT